MYYHINNIKKERNNEFLKYDIKNHTYYYFADIVIVNIANYVELGNVLLDEKSYENILIYDAANRTLYDAKFLCIFEKVEENIRKYDETKYLALFHSDKKNERIFDILLF